MLHPPQNRSVGWGMGEVLVGQGGVEGSTSRLPLCVAWRGLCGTDGKGGRRATWAACRVLLDQRKGKSAVRQQLYPSTARMTQVLEALVVVVLVAISKML